MVAAREASHEALAFPSQKGMSHMKLVTLPLLVLAALASDKKPRRAGPVHYEVKGMVYEVVESGSKSAIGVIQGSKIFYCLTFEGNSVSSGDYIQFVGPVFDKQGNMVVLAPCEIKAHLKRR